MRRLARVFTLAIGLLLLAPMPSKADLVKGKVIDAETREPLPGVQITMKVIVAGGDMGGWTLFGYATTDSLGAFKVSSMQEGKLMITFSLIGFHTARKVDYSFGQGRADTLDIGTIELKPTEIMLREAQVSAQMPRFTVSGDTIIFHPEAFKLKEGARLDELIEKLPGVEKRKEGLFWNNKRLRLMLNGKDLFAGEALVSQLPSEVAENLKLYNKKSEKALHSGKDDGTEDNVLDIKVKPGFMDKWYGSIEGNYMTDKHYGGELNAHYLSDDDPRMINMQMNNENHSVERGSNYIWPHDISNFGKSQSGYGVLGHYWKTPEADQYSSNAWQLVPGINHDDGWADNFSTLQTFLPGEEKTWRQTIGHNSQHTFKPMISNSLYTYLNAKNWINIDFSAGYTKTEAYNETTQDNYSGDPTGELISNQRLYNSATTEKGEAKLSFIWNYAPSKKTFMTIESNTSYSNGSTHEHSTRELNYAREGSEDNRYQYYRTPLRSFSTYLQPSIATWLTSKIYLQLADKVSYAQRNTHREAFSDTALDPSEYLRPTTADAANRMRNVGHDWGNLFTVALFIKPAKPLEITTSLGWKYLHEQTSYSYGSLDTAAVRSSSFFEPMALLKWRIDRTRKFDISYQYSSSNPSLTETFDYLDTTDPMYIRTGNALLKRSHNYKLTANYVRVWPRKQSMITATMGYQRDINPLSSLYAYNPETAVYTLRPVNIRGGYTTNFGLNFDQGLGFFIRLVEKANLNLVRRYGYLALTDIAETPTLNRQRITQLTNEASLSYETDLIQIKAYDNLELNRYRYKAAPTANSTPLYMKYGADMRLKPGNFEFYVNFYDDFRSSYLVDAMNGHRWIVDAGAVWKIFKNKLRITLDADDIFNRERTRSATYSSYQTSESWSQHLHHYVKIGLKYTIDAKAKKK